MNELEAVKRENELLREQVEMLKRINELQHEVHQAKSPMPNYPLYPTYPSEPWFYGVPSMTTGVLDEAES